MSWYLAVLRKYTDFDGRARRKEYWMFALVNFIAISALLVFDMLLRTIGDTGLGLLSGLYTLVILLPGLAVVSGFSTTLTAPGGGCCSVSSRS